MHTYGLTLRRVASVLVTAAVWSAAAAQAQYGIPIPAGGESLKDKGYVVGATPETLSVKVGADNWVLAVQPNATKVNITGTAEPDFLHSGLFVKFSGELDNKGTTLQKEIDQLEIINPPAKKGAAGAFDSAEEEAKPVAKPVDGTTYVFRTKVSTYKPGELTFSVGGKKVVAKTSASMTVAVNASDLSMVREGDSATFSAWYTPQQKPNTANLQPGYAAAQDIKITMNKPLAATRKLKAPPPAKTPRGSKAPAASEETPETKNPFSR
jgi:hypothetical protein